MHSAPSGACGPATPRTRSCRRTRTPRRSLSSATGWKAYRPVIESGYCVKQPNGCSSVDPALTCPLPSTLYSRPIILVAIGARLGDDAAPGGGGVKILQLDALDDGLGPIAQSR